MEDKMRKFKDVFALVVKGNQRSNRPEKKARSQENDESAISLHV